LRSAIIKEATTTVLLSPATKQSLGLRAQVEALRVTSADADVKNPDIFKAWILQIHDVIQILTYFLFRQLISKS
jgi:hypothetical protein